MIHADTRLAIDDASIINDGDQSTFCQLPLTSYNNAYLSYMSRSTEPETDFAQ